MDDMGTNNMLIYQTAIDTEGGQSGTAIFCKTKHLCKPHSFKEKTVVFGIHVGGSVRKPFYNVGTIISNDILCKIYDIKGIPTSITRVSGMDSVETWRPKIVEFQAHVGIHFGVDGITIAFAFECGKKIWQQIKTINPNIKDKSSMLLDANFPYELIAFGMESTAKYQSMKNKKELLYFENFVMSLCNQEILKIETIDEKDEEFKDAEYISQIKAKNGKAIATKTVFIRCLQHIKNTAMETLQQVAAININNVYDVHVQWILSIPSILFHIKSVVLEAAEECGIRTSSIIDHVLIVTEPECVRANINQSGKETKKCILVWLGEETAYMDCFVDNGNKIKKIFPTQVATKDDVWKSSCVDDAFCELLRSMCGNDLIEQFKKISPNNWMLLMDNFKKSKFHYNCYDEKKDDFTEPKLFVPLDIEFIKFIENNHNKGKSKQFVNIVKEFKYNEKDGLIEYDEGILELSATVCNNLFNPILKAIIEGIDKLLKRTQMDGCSDIILGGVLSKSKFIENKIKNNYGGYHVHGLSRSNLTVAKGAATIGLNQSKIKPCTTSKSIAIKTYGSDKNDMKMDDNSYFYTLTPKYPAWFKCVELKQCLIAIKLYSMNQCIGIGFLPLPDDFISKSIAISYYNQKKLFVVVKDWPKKDREIKVQWIDHD
eukprot:373424_1